MDRFETEILTRGENLQVLLDLPGIWVDRVKTRKSRDWIVLDLDSSVIKTYGNQEGSAYNDHFGCECYHPLFCFNQSGDVEWTMLRKGNVHSADDWRSVLEPVVECYKGQDGPELMESYSTARLHLARGGLICRP